MEPWVVQIQTAMVGPTKRIDSSMTQLNGTMSMVMDMETTSAELILTLVQLSGVIQQKAEH